MEQPTAVDAAFVREVLDKLNIVLEACFGDGAESHTRMIRSIQDGLYYDERVLDDSNAELRDPRLIELRENLHKLVEVSGWEIP